jgi:hypothetical protein
MIVVLKGRKAIEAKLSAPQHLQITVSSGLWGGEDPGKTDCQKSPAGQPTSGILNDRGNNKFELFVSSL